MCTRLRGNVASVGSLEDFLSALLGVASGRQEVDEKRDLKILSVGPWEKIRLRRSATSETEREKKGKVPATNNYDETDFFLMHAIPPLLDPISCLAGGVFATPITTA